MKDKNLYKMAIWLLFFILLIAVSGLRAQMVIPGIYVGPEASLYVGEGLTVTGNDSLIIEGTLIVEDSLITSDGNMARVDGKIVLSGSDTILVETNGLRVDTLEIATGEDQLRLLDDLGVNQQLYFTSGNLYLNGNQLKLGAGVTIEQAAGYSVTVPIVADGLGKVVLEGFDDSLYVPFGFTNAYLNPLSLKNTGAADTFYLGVMSQVMEDGMAGNTLTDDVVQVSWLLEDAQNAAYDLSATVSWHADQEGSGFDNTQAGVARYHNNDWDLNDSELEDLSSRVATYSGITDVDMLILAIADSSSDVISSSGFNLSIKLFLEGPYDDATGEMTTNLNSLIPDSASHPNAYGSSAYNYSGTENLSGNGAPNTDVVDWILIELRDAASVTDADASTTLVSMAGLLLKDGSVVSVDGSTALNTGELSITNNLYLVVKHRNHADVITSIGLSNLNDVFTYDFTTAATQAYGSSSLSEVATGVYALWQGDINADATVKYGGADNDASVIYNSIDGNSSVINTLTGYYIEDVNMDGTVQYAGSGNDVTLIYNTIDGNSSVINTQVSNIPQ
jgi:hypothetical protein